MPFWQFKAERKDLVFQLELCSAQCTKCHKLTLEIRNAKQVWSPLLLFHLHELESSPLSLLGTKLHCGQTWSKVSLSKASPDIFFSKGNKDKSTHVSEIRQFFWHGFERTRHSGHIHLWDNPIWQLAKMYAGKKVEKLRPQRLKGKRLRFCN